MLAMENGHTVSTSGRAEQSLKSWLTIPIWRSRSESACDDMVLRCHSSVKRARDASNEGQVGGGRRDGGSCLWQLTQREQL